MHKGNNEILKCLGDIALDEIFRRCYDMGRFESLRRSGFARSKGTGQRLVCQPINPLDISKK